MKDWFNKLKDKYKLLLIIGSLLSVYLFSGLSQLTEFFLLFCAASLVFTCIFTVYFVMYKISSRKKKTPYYQNLTTYQNLATPQSVSSDTNPQTEQLEKRIEMDGDFPKIFDGYFRRWQYRENIPYAQNLDKLELNDSDIDLVPEPDNQYDPNAVALYKGEYKLGYLYKGQTQEMVLSYLNREDYEIPVAVCLLDPETNRLAVKIAFYRKLDAMQLETLTVPLIRITKKAEEWSSSRYENLAFKNVGDLVEITENDEGRYTVCDECGSELGELSASGKMEDIFDGIMYAQIADIENYDDTYHVKISIFYR